VDKGKKVNSVTTWFKTALRPDPIMTVWEWADKYRVLSKKASSEAGAWRTERTPYLREIMAALSITNSAKKVVFKKSSQVGGTECGNNWIGYVIDHVPGPFMLVMPTVDTAKRNSKLRIDPLIEESPRLVSKVKAAKSRDKSNTVQQKDFEGGTLIMTGANSAAGLKSTPCRFVMLDELDEYEKDVEGQGDPVSLVLARSRTFSRRKAFLVSTPTIDGLSKIEEEFKDSDQRHFYVPCPHCNGFQILKWGNVQYDAKKPRVATYFCEVCGEEIHERYKTKMLEAGEWRAHNPGHETVGFFINSLYSPLGWYSWGDAAHDYEEAKREFENEKKSEKMKSFVNTVLGEAYKEPGEAPEWKRLYLRRENYPLNIVPNGTLFLTCGVDVQKDRLELEVVAWQRNKVSYSLAYEVLVGDPTKQEVWNDLADYITKDFEGEDGKSYPIRMTGVDSGYHTTHVYNFVRRFSPSRVVATKGKEDQQVILSQPKAVDVKQTERFRSAGQ
jgi:phage terminase large subunit GpA-like protein